MARIAIDLDGVLFDMCGWVVEDLRRSGDLPDGFTVQDWDHYNLNEQIQIDHDRYWSAFGPRMIRCCPLMDDAQWFLRSVASRAEVVLLTSRSPDHAGPTLERLLSEGLQYDRVVHEANKAQWCLDNAIDCLVDDAPHQAEATQCAVVLMDAPYNRTVQRPNVDRAHTLVHAHALLLRHLYPAPAEDRWPDIETKQQMYCLMNQGSFGNRAISFETIDQAEQYAETGAAVAIRTKRPGGPFLVLDAANLRSEHDRLVAAGEGINLTPVMPDQYATLQCYVRRSERFYDLDEALGDGPLRWAMRTSAHHTGLRAAMMLQNALCPNSLADLEAIWDRWPDATVELTAYRCDISHLSTVPGRNTVIWEVRHY